MRYNGFTEYMIIDRDNWKTRSHVDNPTLRLADGCCVCGGGRKGGS